MARPFTFFIWCNNSPLTQIDRWRPADGNDGGASNKRAKKAAEKGTKSATKQQVADFVANTEKGGGDSSKNNEDSPWVRDHQPDWITL
jgi:hypothetical protein